jgi:Fe-S-cluster containining protein
MSLDIAPYIDKLAEIFAASDALYSKSQGYYITTGGDGTTSPFSCTGCTDNCCTTVFYHYTLLEYFYLTEGLSQITDTEMAGTIAERSQAYSMETARNPFKTDSLRIMCPLNIDGMCAVYRHRPLICRVHGVPSSLSAPGKQTQRWDGCKRFTGLHGVKDFSFPVVIDRTPFYTQIAALEGQLRRELVFFQKYKKTIAEMVLDYIKDEPFLSTSPAPPPTCPPACPKTSRQGT